MKLSSPPTPLQRAQTATFLAVLAVGLVATLLNPALLDAPDASLRDGSWARAYQATLDASSPLRPASVAWWNAIDLGLFRQAPAGVVLGGDGWLFTDEEYLVADDDAAARAAWVDSVAKVSALLEADGVTLLVVLLPAKARMVHVDQPPLPLEAAERYEAVRLALEVRGVDVVDLRSALDALGEAAWLRTDTHWTPAGAAAAAAVVADRLRTIDPTIVGGLGTAVEAIGHTRHVGDLLRLLALGSLQPAAGPEPDRLVVEQFVRPPPAATDLFAAVEIPVTVVGTSYTTDDRWGLAVRLEVALGADTLDAGESGRGPAVPLAAYLEGAAFADNPPRAVVWEIPERYLGDMSALTAAGPSWHGAGAERP